MLRSVFQIFTLMTFLGGQITFANANLISFHRQLTADDTEARQLVEVDLLQLQSKEVEETNKRIYQ